MAAWRAFNRRRYRMAVVVAYAVMALSVVVSAQPVDANTASSWLNIGTAIAGGLVSSGVMFGLLQGRLSLFEYRLDKSEERVTKLENEIMQALTELRGQHGRR